MLANFGVFWNFQPKEKYLSPKAWGPKIYKSQSISPKNIGPDVYVLMCNVQKHINPKA